MRKTMSQKAVAALRPRAARYAHPDPQMTGHYVRVQPSGAKSFVVVARSPAGKQIWATLGAADVLEIEEARELAREAIKRIRAGLAPTEPPSQSFQAIAEQWLARHVEPNGLRSAPEITRLLKTHVFPAWKDREFLAIRRSDVAALLDHVQDNHGARQADYVLNIVRSIMNWYATRHDDFSPPIVRGMRRQQPSAQARAWILDDAELRAIWKQAENNGTFGAIVRFALLTAQRRSKICSMKWADVSIDGDWTIPTEPREKGTVGSVQLPKPALAIIRAQPRLAGNPYVFAGRGPGPFRGLGQAKLVFDRKLTNVAPYVIHDLRRTARSLMSRAGVQSELAERIMGHVAGGVEGIYDRHQYRDEKAEALQKLAALIDGIVHPRENVVPMTKQKRK